MSEHLEEKMKSGGTTTRAVAHSLLYAHIKSSERHQFLHTAEDLMVVTQPNVLHRFSSIWKMFDSYKHPTQKTIVCSLKRFSLNILNSFTDWIPEYSRTKIGQKLPHRNALTI